jgi:hypothetical protein
MALIFVAIDPNTNGDHCPAVFIEEETGDLLFQGWTVTDPADTHRRLPPQPHRRQRIRGKAPGPYAGDHHGGAQWPRCHHSAS